MKFWRRVKFYGVGLIIGIILSVILFKGRGCSWLPENRILDQIGSSTIKLKAEVLCMMEAAKISEEDLRSWLKKGDFEVYFSESETRADPKVYVLKRDVGKTQLRLEVVMLDSVVRIDKLRFENESTPDCQTSEIEYLLWMPEKQIKNGIAKRKLTATQSVLQQVLDLGVDLEECKRILLEGKVSENLSETMVETDPIWVMEDNTKVGKIKVKFVMGENQILIIDVSTKE